MPIEEGTAGRLSAFTSVKITTPEERKFPTAAPAVIWKAAKISTSVSVRRPSSLSERVSAAPASVDCSEATRASAV